MAHDWLARPQLDMLEERPLTQLFIPEDHRECITEPSLGRIFRVLDVQLDIQIALGDLLGRDRERVETVRVGRVLGLLENRVLVVPLEDRPPDRDRRPGDRLAGADLLDLAGVGERLGLRGSGIGLGLCFRNRPGLSDFLFLQLLRRLGTVELEA